MLHWYIYSLIFNHDSYTPRIYTLIFIYQHQAYIYIEYTVLLIIYYIYVDIYHQNFTENN